MAGGVRRGEPPRARQAGGIGHGPANRARPWQALLKPAGSDCNLACAYCFYRRVGPELYPGQAHRMSPEIMRAAVGQLLALRQAETIFSWQGGEPTLMGLGFFEQVIAAQQELGRSGQVVGNALQTNGLLLDHDWGRFLARHRFVVGLSLDGPRELHDANRRDHAGQGTFDRVMAAVELLRGHNVTFNILAVVNRLTQERAPEIYRFFRAQGLGNLQFIPCLDMDPAQGRPTDYSVSPEGLARFWRDLWHTWAADGYPGLSERNLDAVLSCHLSGQPGLCTWDSSCQGYLVIEHNGDAYPCDFFVTPEWRLGNVTEKPLRQLAASPLMRAFLQGKARLAPQCQGGCDWSGWCHGGCLKDRLPHQGRQPGKSLLCPAYQELFRESFEKMEDWAGRLLRPEASAPGRNAPCPCGSGKKYKRCCLNRP
jgi:uncharacterized protein